MASSPISFRHDISDESGGISDRDKRCFTKLIIADIYIDVYVAIKNVLSVKWGGFQHVPA